MQTPENELTKHVIKGLASHLNMFEVTKILQGELKWRVKPVRFMSSQSRTNNNMVLLAAHKPTEKQFEWGAHWCTIVDYIPEKPRRSAWHRAYDRFFE